METLDDVVDSLQADLSAERAREISAIVIRESPVLFQDSTHSFDTMLLEDDLSISVESSAATDGSITLNIWRDDEETVLLASESSSVIEDEVDAGVLLTRALTVALTSWSVSEATTNVEEGNTS